MLSPIPRLTPPHSHISLLFQTMPLVQRIQFFLIFCSLYYSSTRDCWSVRSHSIFLVYLRHRTAYVFRQQTQAVSGSSPGSLWPTRPPYKPCRRPPRSPRWHGSSVRSTPAGYCWHYTTIPQRHLSRLSQPTKATPTPTPNLRWASPPT